jgi:hypothetical protein
MGIRIPTARFLLQIPVKYLVPRPPGNGEGSGGIEYGLLENCCDVSRLFRSALFTIQKTVIGLFQPNGWWKLHNTINGWLSILRIDLENAG